MSPHVANFQRFEPAFTCPAVSAGSGTWRTLLCACSASGCACEPSARHLCVRPRMSRNQCESSGDAAGTAKESQAETMQTQVEITEQGSKECEKRTSAQKGTTWLTVLPGYRGRPCHGRPCYPGTEAACVTADRVTWVPRLPVWDLGTSWPYYRALGRTHRHVGDSL